MTSYEAPGQVYCENRGIILDTPLICAFTRPLGSQWTLMASTSSCFVTQERGLPPRHFMRIPPPPATLVIIRIAGLSTPGFSARYYLRCRHQRPAIFLSACTPCAVLVIIRIASLSTTGFFALYCLRRRNRHIAILPSACTHPIACQPLDVVRATHLISSRVSIAPHSFAMEALLIAR